MEKEMTDKERIDELEKKVKKLEQRPQPAFVPVPYYYPHYIPVWPPTYPAYPNWITYTSGSTTVTTNAIPGKFYPIP
jgi:hypothetical protein